MHKRLEPVRNQRGFLHLPNDNIVKTFMVALCLCLVCSVVVSTAATYLKPRQVANKLIDKKRNIVEVAGLSEPGMTVEQAFEQIDSRVVNLTTGDYDDSIDPISFDQRRASKDPALSIDLDNDTDVAGIGRRANLANVYLLKSGDDLEKVILPIKGYGLWSTMYGFVALESDLETVSGITFYEHGETPGLGGEIENPRWQQSWRGKRVFDAAGEPVLQVIKGTVGAATPNPQPKVDGLAGAALTRNGVSNMISFWLGQNGFGPYLNKLRAESVTSVAVDDYSAVAASMATQ